MIKNDELKENSLVKGEYIQYIKAVEKDLMSGVKQSDIQMYNPATLAYIGDSVYELFVRTLLISEGNVQVSKLHKKAINFVKAKAQAEMVNRLADYLTEEEKNIIRRGRNAKTTSMPKNANLTDYKYATGFEALLGYLYLNNHMKRLMEILHLIININNEYDQQND